MSHIGHEHWGKDYDQIEDIETLWHFHIELKRRRGFEQYSKAWIDLHLNAINNQIIKLINGETVINIRL
jgi:transcriptional antiterminator Rof (Rho-off)